MSAPIGPGDYVECIDVAGFPDIVSLGAIYLVEEVTSFGAIPCLILRGVAHPKGYRRVRADCFRPIYRPGADLIRQLKQPAPEAEGELEEVA